MSHMLFPLRRQRLQRSGAGVPASNPAMIDKAGRRARRLRLSRPGGCGRPARGRNRPARTRSRRLNDIDWAAKGKTVSVRINGLDTHYMYRDVVDVMEQAGDRVQYAAWCPRWARPRISTWSRRW